MIMLKDIGVKPVPNYTRDIKKGIAGWDAYLSMSPTQMPWRQNLLCAMSGFFNHSATTTTTVCGDLKSGTLTDMYCSSAVLKTDSRFAIESRRRQDKRNH